MTLVEFVIFGLATWRISSLLTGEEGPWHVFYNLRARAGIIHDESAPGRPVMVIPDRFLPNVLSCVWCCSVWVAGGLYLLWVLLPPAATVLATIVGLSGFAIGVERVKV